MGSCVRPRAFGPPRLWFSRRPGRRPQAAARFCRPVLYRWCAERLCSRPMSRTGFVILLTASLFMATASAATYMRVEKDGTKTYSDRPFPGATRIDLQQAQSYSTPPPTVQAASTLPTEQRLLSQTENFRYESCSILPANDSSFTNPESVPVSVRTTPALRPGDEVTLTIDGQRVGGPTTLSHVLAPAHRGSHTVAVSISNGAASILCQASATFHVHRPSINSPARKPVAPPPRPRGS